ncbi:hypothetical protein ACOJBM_06605 [Rhizobium beringeri]
MIIDAMDLLYTGRFSDFCIVSDGSDFGIRLGKKASLIERSASGKDFS